jgi:hypothetical protein
LDNDENDKRLFGFFINFKILLNDPSSIFFCTLDTSVLLQECKGQQLIEVTPVIQESRVHKHECEIFLLATSYKEKKFTQTNSSAAIQKSVMKLTL